ncbi:MAG: HyaD/HybD family hydrogenase maturation endopeptidase [Eubacteriales bacterium]
MNRILILGVGNVLLKDEGIGVHVIGAMERIPLPDNVKLVNGGVSGIDLLEVIEEADKLIIVDAIDAGDRPGTVFRFNADEVKGQLREHKTSLHQVDLFDTLKIARFLDRCPETVIIGIQPKDISWGMELTPDLASLVPRIIDLVICEIHDSASLN